MNLIKLSMIIYLFCLIRQVQSSYLLYDTGTVTFTNYPSVLCSSSNTPRSSTITFSGTFPKQPTVLAILKVYDTGTNLVKFYLDIPAPSQTTCKINAQCLTSQALYTLTYSWFAFQDIRITTIEPGVIYTTSSSQTFTYSHNNIYATTGFIVIEGFGYQGALDFFLNLTSVTSSQVIIQYTTNTANLKQIQFLVVIGPAESFTVKKLYQTSITSTTSIYVDLVPDYDLFIPLYGLTYTLTSKALRYQGNVNPQSTNIRYDFVEWGYSQLAKVYYSEVWFNKKNYKVRDPLLCSKMRVTKKFTYNPSPLQLYVKELSKTYFVGDQEVLKLDPGTLLWNLIVIIPCSQSIKIIGWVVKCTSCTQTTYNINQSCYGSINMIEYRIKLIQTEQVYQQITINVTSSLITITQLTLFPQNTILSLELQKVV